MPVVLVIGGVLGVAGVVAFVMGLRGIGVLNEGEGLFKELAYSTGISVRSPQDILDAVAQVDPANAPDLQPGYGGAGLTWCNKFMALVTAQLGAPLPYGDYGTLVNAQISWLASGGNGGWRQLSGSAEAENTAKQGQVVVATYYNYGAPPDDHGHMALVLPLDGLRIAQAGNKNYNNAPLNYGFGALPVVFYAHA